MIIISNDLYLGQDLEAGVDPNYPLILWDSILDTGNVTADFEGDSFPAINIVNESTGQFWRSESLEQQYVYIENLNSENVDCLGIARHNFGSDSVAYQLQGSDLDFAAGYQDVAFDTAITDSDPVEWATSWSLANAAYVGTNFNVGTQEGVPQALFIKPDGTKMYVLGSGNDTVYQYTLATPWDASTATYDSISFSVSTQDGSPRGIFFKPDGTRMYVIGDANNTIYQYTLGTAWNVSTASHNAAADFSVNSQETSPRAVFFKADGLKMYVVGDANNTVYQYALSSAWDLSTASYASLSFSVAAQSTVAIKLFFNIDGTRMFVLGNANDRVYQYTLGTAWNVSTASYASISFLVSGQETTPTGMFFNINGSRMYILGTDNDRVYQYDLFDIINGSPGLTASIEINNGGDQALATQSFTSLPVDFGDLVTQLNLQTSNGTWSITGGKLRCTSDDAALFGSPVITDTDLFSSIDGFDEIEDRVTGGETIAWENITDEIMPADDASIIHHFDPALYLYYRLKLTPDESFPQIGHMKLGAALVLQRKIYVGHQPITLNRRSDLVNNTSENGQFLGRIQRRRYLATQVSMSHITPDFYRDNIDPFAEHAETGAFFFAWRPIDYPLEVGYGWTDGDISPVNQLANGMMEFSFGMKAVA